MSSTMEGAVAMPGGFEQPGGTFEPLSGAVSEFVAARRLGLSVDTLRRDRRLGQLGIPFLKYGSGKCGAVRYDPADLERFIESRKRRTLPVARPVVVEQAPVTPVSVPIVPEETGEPAPPPLSIDERRAAAMRRAQELTAGVTDDEDFEPFATGRSPQRRAPGGYFSH